MDGSDGPAPLGSVEAFRRWGWRAADLDPLGLAPRAAAPDAPGAAAAALRQAYVGAIGWEIAHVPDPRRRDWLAREAETAAPPAPEHREAALRLIAEAELLEGALARRLPTVKVFGLAGAEGFLVALEAVIQTTPAREVVIGGMHRGRLAQMALIFGKPLVRLIAETRGVPDLDPALGAASDVPYHLGWEGERPDGRRVWVGPHPSHLSLVGPVAQGVARGRPGALSLTLHTDAALAGQGINAELAQLAGLPGYHVGGTVHLVLDNQVGFTTDPAEGRSAEHCATVARMVGAPVLHVNGDDPDALLIAGRVAARWRLRYGADIFVRVVAFRRRGHNEMDEPRFTQAPMQARIDALPPLSGRYAAAAGLPAPDLTAFRAAFDAAFEAAPGWRPNAPAAPGLAPDAEARMLAPLATGAPLHRLRALIRRLARQPEGMALHPKVVRFLEARAAMAAGAPLDWATAEALALASLLAEGVSVRLSGQDAVRGAFAQRHLRLMDQETGAVHAVLDGFGAEAEVFNTPLIEAAALAFDYGLSLAAPERLVVWEAQFGDFLNVCQSIFDQYVSGGEDRWLLTSRLVMLLPHGHDGGGPDHSTGHPERVLARCAKANLWVVNASTPAQWFHALRRQRAAPLAKPMVALTPKLLLKLPAAVSPLTEFGPGTGFHPVLADDAPGADKVLICSGKVAYALAAARAARGLEARVAIVRLEQLHPFPAEALRAALAAWPAADLAFVQEEPENLGPGGWLDRRLEAAAGRRVAIVSRPPAASPAVGWRAWHDAEEAALMDAALGPL